MNSIFIFLIAIILNICLYYYVRTKSIETKAKVGKGLVLLLILLYIPKTVTTDLFVTKSIDQIIYSNGTDNTFLILRWFYYFGFAIFPIAVFYNSDFFKKIVIFFLLPTVILNILWFNTLLVPLEIPVDELGILGVRYLVEMSVYLATTIFIIVHLRPSFTSNVKKVLSQIWVLPFMLLYMIPFETPGRIFGETTVEVGMFTTHQKMWLYGTVFIMFVLYNALKNKSDETKKNVLLFMAAGLAYQYMGYFRGHMMNLGSIPIQLCNFGSVLTYFAISTKKPKLFYFAYLVNVTGALLAMLAPDISGGMFGYNPLHFSFEHTFLLMLPILTVSLGLMPRVKKEELKSAIIAFSVYFMIVLLYGSYVNAYTEHSPDFFFLFTDYIADILIFTKPIRNITFSVGLMIFYPVYQFMMFLGYIAFMWLLLLFYRWVYSFIDELEMLLAARKIRKSDARMNLENKGQPKKFGKVVVELQHFKKKYGGSNSYAVKDLSLEVREGEVFGFLGTNGAGKSTTIKSIVGILPITGGDIKICGHSLKTNPLKAKEFIGYVPDNHAIYERLTGREYINHIADLYGVSEEDRTAVFNRFVKMFNLEKSIDQQIKSYSHGMKQKTAIIAALIHEPKLWILDEPLTGLDPESTYEIKQYMKEHVAKGNTVFFSSHILDVVEKLCDRVAIIKDGDIVGIYDMHELEKGQDSLEKVFLAVAKQK
jgi:ABC-2 type transport system ATP-binding protein